MAYGHFDDAAREFVITRPDTPSPWINYLGSETFFTLMSNTSGGYSFYKDARLLRITRYRYNNVPLDEGGLYFYIRDNGTVWNPGWRPMKTPLDHYECRHGLGYTKITGEKNGLSCTQVSLVPRGEDALVTKLTLKNTSNAEKDVSVFSFVEWCLWNAQDDSQNFQRNFSTGEVEVEGSVIYHKTEYRERRNHYALFAVNAPVEGFDTDRDAFLGAYNGFSEPAAVLEGRSRMSVASGWAPVASHHVKACLAPGEEKSFLFVLGYIENPKEEKFSAPGVINKVRAKALLAKFERDDQFEAALAAQKAYWDDMLSIFNIRSGDERFDRQVNIWNQYQCMVTFNMSRSASYYESGIGRGMGFRDSSQDLLGFVHLIPSRARERILDIAATQFEDGSAYHQYQPLTKRGNFEVGSGFNDDPLWLIFGVSAYIKESGDLSILNEKVPFDNDEGKAQTLMEHLRRSFHYTLDHLGPHGLPLIGRADWNDCLNLNCFSETPGESFQTTANFESGVAESVFIAGMFVSVADDYAALCARFGWAEEAGKVPAWKAQMTKAIEEHGWDGEYFLRAYDAFGKKVGSHECEEGQIYIEPQGFVVMAGVGRENGMAEKAMASVREKLLSKHGVAILAPAYTKYHVELGEVSSYPPGYKENGGIFCHNNPWIVLAEAGLGHGDRAFDIYRRTCPAYIEDQQLHHTEPYVYSQMVAGPEAPRFGQAKNSWLTGTAAWGLTAATQGILGIKPQFDGLMVEPCLPACMEHVQITRKFRGCVYDIRIENKGRGERHSVSMKVDGKDVNGCVVPACNDGGTHVVDVTIE